MRWFVFARREYDQPVARRAAIDAGDVEAAATLARERFGDWLEVRLVPEESVRWIIGPLPAEKLPDEEREEMAAV
jgi:hypothetical protein